ncbi:hypothetical protein E2C01_101333 [Portunus trituberculatus]|uniref:Uncharacterized protein n=1 Tax=Portunus trituberculatus TaxID=210409 RepID=A0A5B7KAF2_PORTR|nr:hypothetical protein [Portunus trituberculatus]
MVDCHPLFWLETVKFILRNSFLFQIMPLADVLFPNSFKALLEAGTGTCNSHSRNYLLGLDGNVFLARVTPSLSYILGPHRYGAFLFKLGSLLVAVRRLLRHFCIR